MEKTVKIFASPYELAEKFAEGLVSLIADSVKRKTPFTIVLSGGSTPELLYSVLGDHFSASVSWDNVHFFWGDERCVPPGSRDSNYGMAGRALLSKINIPLANIHRIRGEEDAEKEAIRYSREISVHTRIKNGIPAFDLIILGLGEDGHTASVFPSNIGLMESEKICETAIHPVSRQKRVTITGRVINNAERVSFMVTGKNKAAIVERILNNRPEAVNYPASLIVPEYGILTWLLDKEAAELI